MQVKFRIHYEPKIIYIIYNKRGKTHQFVGHRGIIQSCIIILSLKQNIVFEKNGPKQRSKILLLYNIFFEQTNSLFVKLKIYFLNQKLFLSVTTTNP